MSKRASERLSEQLWAGALISTRKGLNRLCAADWAADRRAGLQHPANHGARRALLRVMYEPKRAAK